MTLQFKIGDYVSFGANFGVTFGYIEKIEHINVNLSFQTLFDIRSSGVLFPGVNENYVYAVQTIHTGTGGTKQDLLDALKTGNSQKVANSLCLGADPRTAIKQATYALNFVDLMSHVANPFGMIIGFNESNSQFEERVIDYIVSEINLINLTNGIFINTAAGDQLDTIAGLVKCSHSWKIYDSGWTQYEYCSKCDEKRG